jgi:hypothetical protein
MWSAVTERNGDTAVARRTTRKNPKSVAIYPAVRRLVSHRAPKQPAVLGHGSRRDHSRSWTSSRESAHYKQCANLEFLCNAASFLLLSLLNERFMHG